MPGGLKPGFFFTKRETMSEEQSTTRPNYDIPCEVCGQKPTVDVVSPDGEIEHMCLCGVCCFGEADCVDPEKW